MSAKITSLEAGRGIAALAVVIHHATLIIHHETFATKAFVLAIPHRVAALTLRGYLGVDFFFVLSGFIIHYTNHGKPSDGTWATNYGESRLIRIFVPYLPVGLGLAAVYTLLPGTSAVGRGWSWLASTTLLPTDSPTALGVAWTLRHELLFYGLFLVAHKLGRPLLIVGCWAGLCLLVTIFFGSPEGALTYPFGLINVEFFFGVLAAQLVISGRLRSPGPFMVGGLLPLALFIGLGAERSWSLLVGLALAFWIVPMVRAEQSASISVPSSAVFLGAASYSLYLVHNPLIRMVIRSERDVPLLRHWWAALTILVLVSVIAGIAYHLIGERPLLATIKHWRRRMAHRRKEAIGGAGPQIE